MKLNVFISFFLISNYIFCQNIKKDSIIELKEIIITEKRNDFKHKKAKSIDNSLEDISNLNLIKRGIFAWEPFLNDMSQERTTQTISGMRVFTACPDKMDSVHSYLEGHNLSNIEVTSANKGAIHGVTIGGNIDFQLKTTDFSKDFSIKNHAISSFKTNNEEMFFMIGADISSKQTSGNISISLRKANDYTSGNGQKIDFSGYKKFNFASYFQQKITQKSFVFSHFIFDKATDVGYPALVMDTQKAQGVIVQIGSKTSLKQSFLKEIKSQLYANFLHHIMSDKLRPIVPFRMDMPSRSDTFGLSCEFFAEKNRFSSTLKFDVFHNFSVSQMIMHYNKGGQMKLFTLPEIKTLNGYIFFKNEFKISENQHLGLNVGFSAQRENLGNLVGEIFYPEMKNEKVRKSPSIGVNFKQKVKSFSFDFSSGYGQRPPSFTESYGIYVFNNYDGFEYIGNPFLSNEKSFNTSVNTSFLARNTKISFQANYFYIQDYIIGKIFKIKGGSPMMYGSSGLKNYVSLPYARQFNANISISQRFFDDFMLKIAYKYSFGQDFNSEMLPFIPPKIYFGQISYKKNNFEANFSSIVNQNKDIVSKYSGETPTKSYFLLNFEANYNFNIKKIKVKSTFNVENILNRNYTTYASWNKIPQMGRNILLKIELNN